jgi:P27 family predicted phage terminase small subunit
MQEKQIRNRSIPSSISNKAKRFMKDLLEVLDEKSIHTKLDSAAISLLAHTYDNYIRATEMIEHDGLIVNSYSGTSKTKKAHPAIKIQLDAQIQLTKLLVEFGLTPKSRKDIESAKAPATDSPLELFIKSQREVR